MTDIKMEELVSIVGELAGKYTGYESTSITYEKAEQLMGAVLYCIREVMQAGGGAAVFSKEISAGVLYEQRFLRKFPRESVIRILKKYNTEYEETPDNICEIVMRRLEEEFSAPEEVVEICD